MWRLVVRRLVAALATLLAMSVVIFMAVEVLPGDAATAVLGPEATPESVDSLRRQLDLDRPAISRYAEWITGVVSMDLGRSIVNRVPVVDLIGYRLVNSAVLLAVTTLLLAPLSLLLGTLTALRRGPLLDTLVQAATLSFQSVPEFVLGVALVWAFAVMVPLLPAVSLSVSAASLVLPTATLLLHAVAYTTRMVRARVDDVLASPHVAMARLRGLSERRVILGHVLPNALGPFVHAMALTMMWLAGGIVVVEYLFAYPGVGQGLVAAVASRDIPTVEALTLILGVVYVASNLAADLFTILTNPRLRARL